VAVIEKYLASPVRTVADIATTQRLGGNALRSVLMLLEVTTVIAAVLVVAGGLFALAIGKEYVCQGAGDITEHGVNILTLLASYCT
jgi:hypothetical protein